MLGRFAFGPRPGDVQRVTKMGADKWFEAQLKPNAIDDASGMRAVASYAKSLEAPEKLGALYAKDKGGKFDKLDFRKLAKDAQMSQLARYISSERQLQEVMTDFWGNHFNVFARKGKVKIHANQFLETAIRANALGRFETLLRATAQHPAMLIYLDNARSRRDGKKKRGLNENYARELLELHTLGVDGGYTQKDIIEVARILTGWTVKGKGAGYVFNPKMHDRGEKKALGKTFAPAGEQEGLALLTLLAAHPSTARHLSTKLCARFVADQPPASCVKVAEAAYKKSKGEIAVVLRAIFQSPSFWAPKHRNNKLKTPLEFLVSAVRALGGHPDGSPKLAQHLGSLGQPLLMLPIPTGYPEEEAAWASSQGILQRMNIATLMATGSLPGATLALDTVVPEQTSAQDLAKVVGARILGQVESSKTVGLIAEQVKNTRPKDARTMALALALGGPDFQRQ